jgi:cellulose biosynthesis protein BcsQ
MSNNTKPLSIATLSLMGDCSKTIITFLLSQTISRHGRSTLNFDLDPSMSLTQLQSDSLDDTQVESFRNWMVRCASHQKTFADLIEKSADPMEWPHGELDDESIYPVSAGFHLVPGSYELHKTDTIELPVIQQFFQELLEKISNSGGTTYDALFFDCPPYFSNACRSVLPKCDIALIPVHPTLFGKEGLKMQLEMVYKLSQGAATPKIGVLLNQVAIPKEDWKYHNESRSRQYIQDIEQIIDLFVEVHNCTIRMFNTTIPKMEVMQYPLNHELPPEMERPFLNLWQEIEELVQE